MVKLFDKYFTYLGDHPEVMTGVISWSIVVYFSWAAMIYYRKDIMTLIRGEDRKLQGPEALLFIVLILIPPVVMDSVSYHRDIPYHTLIFMCACTIVGVFGRWGLEWIGNMVNRKGNPPQEPPAKVTTITETTIK